MSGKSNPWEWSATLNQWYIPTTENGRCMGILQNGTRIPLPTSLAPVPTASEPRYVQLAPQNNLHQNQPQSRPSSGVYTYGTNASQVLAQQASLDQRLQDLSLSSPQTSSNFRYQDFQQTRDGNGVSSSSATGPKQSITDPGLFQNGVVANKMFFGSDPESERLDPAYKKRSSSFFSRGKVFLTLWSEPTTREDPSTEVTRVRFGQTVFSRIRRFIVIKEGPAFCTAVQITTYTSQGVSKAGIKKSDHAIVHTGTDPPSPLPEEEAVHPHERMLQPPIRIDPVSPGDKLDALSRINYGKVYTIEHNLKVKPFGMVIKLDALANQFQQVWFTPRALNARITPAGRDAGRASQQIVPAQRRDYDAPVGAESSAGARLVERQYQARQEAEAQRAAARQRQGRMQPGSFDVDDASADGRRARARGEADAQRAAALRRREHDDEGGETNKDDDDDRDESEEEEEEDDAAAAQPTSYRARARQAWQQLTRQQGYTPTQAWPRLVAAIQRTQGVSAQHAELLARQYLA